MFNFRFSLYVICSLRSVINGATISKALTVVSWPISRQLNGKHRGKIPESRHLDFGSTISSYRQAIAYLPVMKDRIREQ